MGDKPTYEELEQRIAELEKDALRHREAEKALRQSEGRYKQLIKNAPAGICEIDSINQKFVSVNDVICEYTGYTREELFSMNPVDILAEDSKRLFKERLEKLLAAEEIPQSTEFKMRGKDGRESWVVLNIRVALEDGKPRRAIIIAHDNTKFKQAERVLRESEEKFRSVVENAKEGIIIVQDDKIVYINPKVEQLSPFSKEEIFEKNFLNFVHPDDRKSLIRRYLQVAEGKRLYESYDYRIIDKQGNTRWVSVNSANIDYQGKSAVLVFLTEITKRKQAEEVLKESVRLYRMLAENVHDILWTMDLDMNFTYISPSVERLSGYSVEEMMARSVEKILTPASYKLAMDVLAEELAVEKSGEEYDPVRSRMFEAEQNCKDGSTIWTEVTTSFLRDKDGKPVGILGVTRDISGRKRIEAALRESEEKYRELVESINAIIYTVDRNGVLTYINPAAKSVLGYGPSQIVGKSFTEFIFEEDLPHMKKHFQGILCGDTNPSECRLLNKYGEVRWVRAFSEPARMGNNIIGLKGVAIDITENKKAEEEKKELEAQLLRSQKMQAIGTLAGGIAHEFNNVLWLILGNTELALANIPEGTPAHHSLKMVEMACYRAKDIVRQILGFSRQTEQKRIPLKISSIVKESLKLLRSSIPKTIEIRQDISTELDTALADPTQINQVVMNLCTNASYAMREGGGILEVRLEPIELDKSEATQHQDLNPGKYIRLTVQDTGHGIEPEVIERIFDPFFTTKEVGEGTGMGLSVVHGIVKSHGGVTSVNSEPGKGATFQVFIPSIESEVKPQIEAFEDVTIENARILFVDDETELVDMVKQLLEHKGYQVESKTSAAAALEVFRARPDEFDLVITDMTMPHMTGEKFAIELMAIRPDIPIILCTGYNEMISAEKAKALGIKEFVMKPIIMREMARTIRKVLDKT
jgi:PAS domain S-box-containing protein